MFTQYLNVLSNPPTLFMTTMYLYVRLNPMAVVYIGIVYNHTASAWAATSSSRCSALVFFLINVFLYTQLNPVASVYDHTVSICAAKSSGSGGARVLFKITLPNVCAAKSSIIASTVHRSFTDYAVSVCSAKPRVSAVH